MIGGIYTNYQNELKRQIELEKQIIDIKKELECLPDGKLICSKNGKYFKWFHSDGVVATYIPKSNRKYAELLAIKTYLSLKLEDLEKEKQALQKYAKQSPGEGKAQKLLEPSSGFKELLKPYFTPISEELILWANEPYERNQRHPEQLSLTAVSGNRVRSKSELLIDTSLYHHKIPFRYENQLKINNQIFYPDFTIRHPQNGKTYYWEHFGMMDDPSYARNAFSKMQFYSENGIIPDINLITTYETREHPLGMDLIEKIISHYFLE